jgi:hypothetical protein
LPQSTSEHSQRVVRVLDEHDGSRQLVSGFVCAASMAGWKTFSETFGVTLTALLDAMGHRLAAHAQLPPDRIPVEVPGLDAAIDAARRIDARRRSRNDRNKP